MTNRITHRIAQPALRIPGAEDYSAYDAIPWDVYDFEVAIEPRPGLATVYRYRRRPWPNEGVFVPKGAYTTPTAAEPQPIRRYDAMRSAEEILRDLNRTDPADRRALLAFTNRWGLLDQGWHAEVKATRTWLEIAKGITERIYRFYNQEAPRDDWEDLAFDLTAIVNRVHFEVRGVDHGLRLIFKAPRLADVLALHLLQHATGTEKLRQCEYHRCRTFFVPERRDQRYCKTAGEQRCARRASLERMRARLKRGRE